MPAVRGLAGCPDPSDVGKAVDADAGWQEDVNGADPEAKLRVAPRRRIAGEALLVESTEVLCTSQESRCKERIVPPDFLPADPEREHRLQRTLDAEKRGCLAVHFAEGAGDAPDPREYGAGGEHPHATTRRAGMVAGVERDGRPAA